MNDVNDNCAGAEVPTQRKEDFPLWLDQQIMLMLGLRAEIMDEFIKTWPTDVIPDETNWLVGSRFTQSLEECENIIAGLKGSLTLHEQDGNHWAVVTLAQGEIESIETTTKEMAAACAVYGALWGLRKGGHKS